MRKWFKHAGLVSIVLLHITGVQAATPGIPFTEDFSSTALNAAAITSADWNTGTAQLALPEDSSFTPAIPLTDPAQDKSVSSEPDFAIVVGDFWGDGVADDLVYGGDSGLWINGLQLFGSGTKVRDIAAADIDSDGDLDLIIAVRNGNNLTIRNNTLKGPAFTTYVSPFFYRDTQNLLKSIASVALSSLSDDSRAVAVADMNRDGQLDYVFANAGSTANVWIDGASASVNNISNDLLDTRDIALADVDQDGDMDVITGNSNALNKIYLNDGNGGFPGAGASIGGNSFATRSIASGDLNGDGLVDIVVGTAGGMGYFLNSGPTTLFGSVSGKQIGSSSAVVTDVILRDANNDGRMDIIAARRNVSNALFLNDGKAKPFKTTTAEHALSADTRDTRAISAVEATGLKIYSANYNQSVRLEALQTVGNAAARDQVQDISALAQPGKAVASGDVDNDGDLDFVVGNAAAGFNELFINDGSGQFSRQQLSNDGDTRAVLLADVNHDGRLDLLTGNYGAVNRLYISSPFGSLFASGQDITADAHNTTSLATKDLNGDGRLDIVVGNSGQTNRVYMNGLPAGTFSSGSDTAGMMYDTRGLVIADIDQDGDNDILFANADGPNQLIENDGSGGLSVAAFSPDNQASYAVAVIETAEAMSAPTIVVANNGSPNRYYATLSIAEGGGGTDVGNANGNTRSIAVLDLDGNGIDDVVFGNAAQANIAYLNSDWANASTFSSTRATRALSAGDFDGDGIIDVIEINSNQIDRLYRYQHPTRYQLNSNIAQSLEVDNTTQPINGVVLIASETLAAGTSIDYYLTSNGGVNWYAATPGQNTDLPNAGTDLRWRAELQSGDNTKTPILSQLEIRATRVLTVLPSTGGTTTSSPTGIDCGANCEARFALDGDVTLSVALDPQYTVTSWTGAASCGASTSCTFQLDSSKTVSPVIEGVNVLSVAVNGNGKITTADGNINCDPDCTFGYGLSGTGGTEQVELTATADPGWYRSNWTGECSAEANSTCVVVMNTSKSTQATFLISQRTLTVMPVAGINVTATPGAINCQTAGDSCSTTQDHGTSVTLTAVGAGQNFVGWTDDCAFAGSNASCTLILDSDKTVSTVSANQSRTLTVSNTVGGRIYSWSPGVINEFINCGADCAEPFGQNQVVRLRAEAQAGFAFAGWDNAGCDSIDGAPTDPNCNLTMTTDRSLTTAFVPVFTLNITQSGPGLISSQPAGILCDGNFNLDCTEDYVANTAVTLTAEPGVYGTFSGWSGNGCSGSALSCTVTMDQARTISASFSYEFPLSVQVFGQGNVSSTFQPGIDCPDVTCNTDVPENTVVTLNATPAADYDFSGWGGSGCSGSGSCVVTMDGSKTVSATFTLKQYGLTTVLAGTGAAGSGIASSPPGINCESDCFQNYDLNSVVTLTATPAATAYFSGWGNCPSAAANVCSVTIDQAYTVTANFTRHWELVVNNSGGGTVSSAPAGIQCPLDCDEFYDSGSSVTLTATPQSSDYLFDGWSGACVNSSGVCVLDMTQARSVTASFSLKQFTLNVSTSGSGATGSSITSSPAGINTATGDNQELYDINTVVTLTATPSSTAYFSGWTGGGCDAISVNTCTVTLDQAYSVNADFTRHWELTVNNAGGGSVVSGPGSIDCPANSCSEFFDDGTNVTLLATPESTDYLFSGWSGACTGSAICVVSMTQARAVTATFVLKQFDLQVSKTGSAAANSTISSDIAGINCGNDCQQLYDIHQIVTLTATPPANSLFAGWTNCPAATGNTCEVTMEAPISISAEFLQQQTLSVNLSGNGGGTISSVPAGSIDCGSAGGTDCSETVNQGDSLTLSASSDSFSDFSGWFADAAGTTLLSGCSVAGANCSITLSSDVTVYPHFLLRQQNLSVSQTGRGSISSSPAGISTTWLPGGSSSDTQSFDANRIVTLNPSPVTGWRLDSWGGDCSGNSDCTLSMVSDRTVTASFAINQYNLAVQITGSGSVVSDAGVINCAGICNDDYDYGTTVVLTASPLDASWLVAEWNGVSCINFDPLNPQSCTISIPDNNLTASVTFAQSFTLNILKAGSGAGSVNDGASLSCGASCSAVYAPGTSVTLSATAQAGSVFSGWSLPSCTGSGDCAFTINGNQDITATFDTLYTLSVNPGAGGSIIADLGNINCGLSCQDQYADGTLVTLTPQPDAGQVFTGWTGDCSGSGACQVTMDQVHAVGARFDLDGPTLTVNIPAAHGSVSSQPAGIDCGATCVKNFSLDAAITLTATPDAGYLLADWGIPDCSGTDSCQLTMDANKTLTTVFAPDSDGDGIIDSNDNCPADANPDQADANGDGEGDVCDSNSDTDNDGVFDNADNCPVDANPGQEDNNGFEDLPGTSGDACEAIVDDPVCFPIKLANGAAAVICL